MDADNPTRIDTCAPSDDLLHSHVRRVLDSSCYRVVTALECDVKSGVLTLRGVLPSFYLKQIVQSLVLQIEHVKVIDDQMEVV